MLLGLMGRRKLNSDAERYKKAKIAVIRLRALNLSHKTKPSHTKKHLVISE